MFSMKSLRWIAVWVTLLVPFFSCHKEEDGVCEERDKGPFLCDTDIKCRVNAESKTLLNSDMDVVWEMQDRIMVFGDDRPEGSAYHVKELSSDCRTAVFTTDETPVAGELRYAVYPASAFVSYDADSDRITVKMSSEQSVSSFPMMASSKGTLFEFANMYGALMVRPYDIQNNGLRIKSIKSVSKDGIAIGGSAVVDGESGAVAEYEGDMDFVEMVLDEAVDITSNGWTSWSTHPSSIFEDSAKAFVIYVPCGNYPAGFDIILTDADGRSYSFETGPVEIRPGIIERLQYMPLTTYYGTENCICVAPGTTSVEVDVTPYYTFKRNFCRDARKVISAEDIVSSAHVVWQQEYGCQITDIMTTGQSGKVVTAGAALTLSKETDGRQTLTVPLTGSAGNALVAISDAAGAVLWSFHIWVTDVYDIPCNTETGGQYVLMDRNLGATSANDKSQTTEQLIRNSFGLFYQWGRKDPFPRLVHRESRVASASEYRAELPFTSSVLRKDRTVASISYTIRNPHHRIYLENESGCNWLLSYIGELWGFHYSVGDMGRLVAENQLRNGVKTVYDPCPEGYRVADVKHIKGLVVQNEGKLTERDRYYGYHFDTGVSGTSTYIPASGWVKSSTGDGGALYYEGYWGMLWSSSSTVSNAHYLYLHNASTAIFGDSNTCVRGNMCPVRCVKIEK